MNRYDYATLRTFAYAYSREPAAIRSGSAVMLAAGTRVSVVRTEGAYAVVQVRGLLAPVLVSELDVGGGK